ncbi:MAG: hypothetical protein ACRDD7_15105 [Peptostreptococcaceae bacterium]
MKNLEVLKGMKLDVAGCIYSTYDYERFGFIDDNRELNPSNLSKLRKSFDDIVLFTPIKVDRYLNVLDGQHRFTVRKENGLPIIFFISDETAENLDKEQISTSWKNTDYLNKWVKRGIEDYIWLESFINKHQITINIAQKILLISKGYSQNRMRYELNHGEIVINSAEREKMESTMNDINDFAFFEDHKSYKFLSAFIELYSFEKYNHDIMKQKLKTRKTALKKQLTKEDYLTVLTAEIYSFKSSNNRIFYNQQQKSFYSI